MERNFIPNKWNVYKKEKQYTLMVEHTGKSVNECCLVQEETKVQNS